MQKHSLRIYKWQFGARTGKEIFSELEVCLHFLNFNLNSLWGKIYDFCESDLTIEPSVKHSSKLESLPIISPTLLLQNSYGKFHVHDFLGKVSNLICVHIGTHTHIHLAPCINVIYLPIFQFYIYIYKNSKYLPGFKVYINNISHKFFYNLFSLISILLEIYAIHLCYYM